jgi:four helix bundle protein
MIKFHEKLRVKADSYAYLVYKLTKKFPREEIYGITSQLRRAALSVILNYIEGFARGKGKACKNFFNISYSSLKESEYLLKFSLRESYLNKEDYDIASGLADEIGAMLWTTINGME